MSNSELFEWLDPWRRLTHQEAKGLENELKRELSRGHVLRGKSVRALASHPDDVLFEVLGSPTRYAEVHLTWNRETRPEWPFTVFYSTLEEWRTASMIPDHEEFSDPPDEGLQSLRRRWPDGDEFADAVDEVVAHRSPPQAIPDLDDES